MKRHSLLFGRISYSLIIAAVYILGRSIPIPWGAAAAQQEAEGFTALLSGVTGSGADLRLFSLGLTPWIAASILVQALNPILRKQPGDEETTRNRLTAGLTLIFALALAADQVWDTQLQIEAGMAGGAILRAASVLLLACGTFCIVWLARRNEVWGIGGQKLLILINLLDTLVTAAGSFLKKHGEELLTEGISRGMVMGFLFLAALVLVTAFFQKKEYRYPVHRLMIDSRYAQADYLAIRYNPAGTMPAMYALALFSMLGTFASSLSGRIPAAAAGWISQALSLDTFAGLGVFLALFWIATRVASAFMIDPVKTADTLKRSGGYIEGVHPGKATEEYLRRAVRKAGLISAAVMGLLLLLPIAFGILTDSAEEIGTIPVTLILMTGIVTELIDEGGMYRAMQNYRPILDVNGRRLKGWKKEDDRGRESEEAEFAEEAEEEEGTFYFVPQWHGDERLAAGTAKDRQGGLNSTEKMCGTQGVPNSAEKTGGAECVLPAVPVYDDIVHQLQMFRDAGEKEELLIPFYAPQLRHFLHHHGMEKTTVWSAFDELQGIALTRPAVLSWRELDWKEMGEKGSLKGLVWFPFDGVMRGYVQDRIVFAVHFTEDGVLYYVDHYVRCGKDGSGSGAAVRVDRRSIFDDRGFLSSSIRFKESGPGKKTSASAVQKFYDPDGKEMFKVTYPSGTVTLSGLKMSFEDGSGRRNHQRSLSVPMMIRARLGARLDGCTERDAVFLAAEGAADEILAGAEPFAEKGMKVVLSFLESRPAQLEKTEGCTCPEKASRSGKTPQPQSVPQPEKALQSGKSTEEAVAAGTDPIRRYLNSAAMIITDSEKMRERFEACRSDAHVVDVYPAEMSARTGRSGSSAEVVIFMPADWMADWNSDESHRNNARVVVKHLGYLMEDDKDIQVRLGTNLGQEALPSFRKKIEAFLDKGYREWKAQNEVNKFLSSEGLAFREEELSEEMRRKSEEIRKKELSRLAELHKRIDVVSYRTEEELDRILEVTRVMLDARTEPDLRLQIAAVCYGIPQVVCASSRYVRNTENGYVCAHPGYIERGLHYYLEGLDNWNYAHECCMRMVKEYTEENRIQTVRQWKRWIAEERTGK